MRQGVEGHSAIDDYYMPPLDVNTLDDKGMRNLIEGIITRACDDYVAIYRELLGFKAMSAGERRGVQDVIRRRQMSKQELQMFFRSGWFGALAGEAINGDKVMDVLEHDTPWKYLTGEERRFVEDARSQSLCRFLIRNQR